MRKQLLPYTLTLQDWRFLVTQSTGIGGVPKTAPGGCWNSVVVVSIRLFELYNHDRHEKLSVAPDGRVPAEWFLRSF